MSQSTGTLVPPKKKTEAPPSRPSFPSRWGAWMARHRWWVLAFWGVLLLAAVLSYPRLLSSLVATDYSVTGSESQRVAQLLESDFSAAGAEQDVVVFDSAKLTIKDAEYQQAVNKVLTQVRKQPGVVSVLGPTDPGAQGQVSADGHAALATLGLSGDDRQRADQASDLQDVVASAAGTGGVQAYLTGFSPQANDITEVENKDIERAESIGIPVAFVVLLVALGTVVSAFIPLFMAVSGLMATLFVLALFSVVREFDAFLLSIITMIGIGIGIDYSLFVLSRFREELARRRREGHPDPVPAAVGASMATSGLTIAFSGTIVAVSLLSLFVVQSPIFRQIATGTVLVVLCTMAAAWTLLPALLGALGGRVNRWGLPRRWQPAEPYEETVVTSNGWAKWARIVLARPWLALPALALLVLFALPAAGLKLGIDLGMSALSDMPTGKAQAVLDRSFSPGAMSPIQVLASHQGSGALSQADLNTIDKFTTATAKDPRAAGAYSITTILKEATGEVSPQALAQLQQNPDAKTLVDQTVNTANGSNRTLITIVPKSAVDSTEAADLVKELRSTTIPSYTASAGPNMLVGGAPAQYVDLSKETMDKLPIVITIVLVLSFLYLMLIFHALLIPFKAIVMNLLATGAAFGLTAWVFEEGHLEHVFGFTSTGFVQVYLPIMVFAVLFGLSMDYEVFLIGRMREEWRKTNNNEDAVTTGLAHTARPILAAALIMTAVFGCFLVADVLELKEFGFALAIAVLLDATLVRLLLVPAFMKIAGRANWWLPGFLDRHLPQIRTE